MSKFTRGADPTTPPNKPAKQPRQKQPKQVFAPDMTAPVGIMRSACFEFIKGGKGRSLLCPCCDQKMRIYPRPIHAEMANTLIQLYRMNLLEDGRWISVDEIYKNPKEGDYSKLRFWGLIETVDTRHAYRNSAGYWRITELGKRFVERTATVHKYAYIYNNECLRLDGPQVDISVCLGKRFNYADLMAR